MKPRQILTARRKRALKRYPIGTIVMNSVLFDMADGSLQRGHKRLKIVSHTEDGLIVLQNEAGKISSPKPLVMVYGGDVWLHFWKRGRAVSGILTRTVGLIICEYVLAFEFFSMSVFLFAAIPTLIGGLLFGAKRHAYLSPAAWKECPREHSRSA